METLFFLGINCYLYLFLLMLDFFIRNILAGTHNDAFLFCYKLSGDAARKEESVPADGRNAETFWVSYFSFFT